MMQTLAPNNVLARSEYKLPVLSCVLYLFRDGTVKTSPLRWTIPDGQDILEFHFGSIEVGQLTPDELLSMEQLGLLPLLPFTKGGASRAVVEKMFDDLTASKQRELLSVSSTIASLVFSKQHSPDLAWLQRRLEQMHDILRESPFYQQILKEGREEGLEKGREEGLRAALLTVVRARFPKLKRVTKGVASVIEDPDELQRLLLKMSLAQTLEEAQMYLIDDHDDGNN